MRRIFLVTPILTFLAVSAALAAAPRDFRAEAGRYFLAKTATSHADLSVLPPDPFPPQCQPNSADCVKELSGHLNFPSQDQMLSLARSCQGNYDGGCVHSVVGHINYPSYDQLVAIGQACRANFGASCVDALASHVNYPSYDQLLSMARACQGSDAGCVTSLIAHTNYPSYDQLLSMARACGGQ